MEKVKSIVTKIIKPTVQSHASADIVLAVPRVLTGGMLAFSFGADKFGMPWTSGELDLGLFEVIDWFIEDVKSFGGIFEMFPRFFAWMGAGSEAIGGLFLFFGLGTRLAGFLIGCTMLVAIFCQKWDQGLWGMLPAMGFLWVSMYSVILGSGRIGLDQLLNKYNK